LMFDPLTIRYATADEIVPRPTANFVANHWWLYA
jgi:hypothetical protein